VAGEVTPDRQPAESWHGVEGFPCPGPGGEPTQVSHCQEHAATVSASAGQEQSEPGSEGAGGQRVAGAPPPPFSTPCALTSLSSTNPCVLFSEEVQALTERELSARLCDEIFVINGGSFPTGGAHIS